MKNYTYGWAIMNMGYVPVNESKYTDRQINRKKFIESMSPIIKSANCGWDGVRYELMDYDGVNVKEYMVLYCCRGGERWIPIDGNSDGCNFTVLGENLW